MMTLYLILVATQAIGAIVGAGGVVFAEIFYFRAIRDGTIDEAERRHLGIIAHALRVGMLVILCSSIGLALANFVYDSPTPSALTVSYWVLMTLAFIVIFGSWALSRRIISFSIGSGIIFTGWWFIAILVFGHMPLMDYGETLVLFLVSTALVSTILYYLRFVFRPA